MSGLLSTAGAVGLDLTHQVAFTMLSQPFQRTARIMQCDPELAHCAKPTDPDDKHHHRQPHPHPHSLSSSTYTPLRGLRETMKHIYRYEGLWGFWRGSALNIPCHIVDKFLGRGTKVFFTSILTDFLLMSGQSDVPMDQTILAVGRRNAVTWYATFLLANAGISLVTTAILHPLMKLYVRYTTDRVDHVSPRLKRSGQEQEGHADSSTDVKSTRTSHSNDDDDNNNSKNTISRGYRYQSIRDLLCQTTGYRSAAHDDDSSPRYHPRRLFTLFRPLYRGFWMQFTINYAMNLHHVVSSDYLSFVDRVLNGMPSASRARVIGTTTVMVGLYFAVVAVLVAGYHAMGTVVFRQMVRDSDEDEEDGKEVDGQVNQSLESAWIAFRTIVKREGFQALMRGLGTELLGLFIASSVIHWFS
ncbi:hypothetical protein DFQ26_009568 [Actinomortierella ambigua]|nr:hypothetical protein DFQ26_009568 [Actinomortierella ambigua]